MSDDAAATDLAGVPRWRGQPGRVEVWYATASDESTGTGLWVHHELVAPTTGSPFDHGWVAVFEPDEAPRIERFGPVPHVPSYGSVWVAGSTVEPGALRGSAGPLAWDLTATGGGAPMFTFPRWVWAREVLPGAQVVVNPGARFDGTVRVDGRALPFSGRGALSHIYSHGNAQRWAWLHADLDDGVVLEIVTATSRRAGLRRLPPMGFVQLRRHGRDWPRDPLAAAPLGRTTLGLPDWTTTARGGRHRLRAEVHLAPERSVAVAYADPDGSPATCTNSERADAEVVLERWAGGWQVEGQWSLRGTAHAEVGLRGDDAVRLSEEVVHA